jgi:hypothetical protein
MAIGGLEASPDRLRYEDSESFTPRGLTTTSTTYFTCFRKTCWFDAVKIQIILNDLNLRIRMRSMRILCANEHKEANEEASKEYTQKTGGDERGA